jgi:hypothetical protein
MWKLRRRLGARIKYYDTFCAGEGRKNEAMETMVFTDITKYLRAHQGNKRSILNRNKTSSS